MITLETHHFNGLSTGATVTRTEYETVDEALMVYDPTGEAAVLWDRDVAPTFDYTEFTLSRLASDHPDKFARKGTIEVVRPNMQGTIGTTFWRFYPLGSTKNDFFVGWIEVNAEPIWSWFLREEYNESPEQVALPPELAERLTKVANGEPDLGTFASGHDFALPPPIAIREISGGTNEEDEPLTIERS